MPPINPISHMQFIVSNTLVTKYHGLNSGRLTRPIWTSHQTGSFTYFTILMTDCLHPTNFEDRSPVNMWITCPSRLHWFRALGPDTVRLRSAMLTEKCQNDATGASLGISEVKQVFQMITDKKVLWCHALPSESQSQRWWKTVIFDSLTHSRSLDVDWLFSRKSLNCQLSSNIC